MSQSISTALLLAAALSSQTRPNRWPVTYVQGNAFVAYTLEVSESGSAKVTLASDTGADRRTGTLTPAELAEVEALVSQLPAEGYEDPRVKDRPKLGDLLMIEEIEVGAVNAPGSRRFRFPQNGGKTPELKRVAALLEKIFHRVFGG